VKGYRIVARNLRLPQGEIDVVARRGRVLVFIEVKYRADIGLAQDAVTARQWQRIARAAAQFVVAQPALQGLRWRVDVAALAPYHLPRHRLNVWRAA
jgi:putative endonuclease